MRRSLSLSILFGLLALSLAFIVAPGARSAPLQTAKVTEAVEDVRLKAEKRERPAEVGDIVQGSRVLSTGKRSRAELIFDDQSLARLGANSTFSFEPGTRNLRLTDGFLLLHTPKGHGGAKISTPSAAAAVLGTTVLLSAQPDGSAKFIVLEGSGTFTYHGRTVTVGAGEMAYLVPGRGLLGPITIDLERLVRTSQLVKKFRRPIGSEDLIEAAIEAQKSKSKTILLEDNLGPLKDPVEILREHEPVSQPEPAPPRGGGGQFGGGG